MKNSFNLCSVVLAFAMGFNTVAYISPAQGQSIETQVSKQISNPLKSGDRLRLTVVGFPDVSGDHTIMDDGVLQIPLAGIVKVSGLTPTQAATKITEALRPYVRRPQVTLAVLSQSPIRISITGEVLEPGPRSIAPANGEDNGPVTLSSVLSLAGGITPNANLRDITIRRVVPTDDHTGSSLISTTTEIKVDLWQAIQSGDLSADLRIYDGDEVKVPTARINSNDQQLLLTSTVAPTTIVVQVAGAVNDPGRIELDPQSGVSTAIAAAGGLSEDARPGAIARFRMSADGNLEQQTFSFGEASEPLLEGDLIVVDRSTRSNVGGFFNFLSTLLNPVGSFFDIFDQGDD